jgi:hypothetical protein
MLRDETFWTANEYDGIDACFSRAMARLGLSFEFDT